MRSEVGIIALALALGLTAAGLRANDLRARKHSLSERCDVAWEVLESKFAQDEEKRPVFSNERFFGVPKVRRNGWTNPKNWQERLVSPKTSLLRQARSALGEGLLDRCASVQAKLVEKGIGFTQADVQRAMEEPYSEDLLYRAPILSMSLPALNHDGNEAVFYESYTCGLMCASISIVQMRRGTDGIWTVVAFNGLAVA